MESSIVAIVAPVYPECLYTDKPRYHLEWSITIDDETMHYRETFTTKQDAINTGESKGFIVKEM